MAMITTLIATSATQIPMTTPMELVTGGLSVVVSPSTFSAASLVVTVPLRMCFPFLFRGALDTRATEINEPMKLAAANALAELAREEVPFEVSAAYQGREMKFGPEYIMPTPFDPRLLYRISSAVAQAAMDSGVAKKQITDWKEYEHHLKMLTHKTSY